MEPKNELQRNAASLTQRKELESFERALDVQWLNSRMEDGRMGRCLALIKREAEMEKDFQERTDHAAIVNARAEKETKLGIEIAKVCREEACQLLRRHYLWERDPGLRNLAKKLEAGYVCRDLRQQILHNDYRRLQEKSEDRKANDILLNALYNNKEAKEREERLKMKSNSQYCKELQQQLVNRQQVKQCQYEESLIEKKMLKDIMRTISDEDQRELKQKRERMEKMRNEMVTFKEARKAWKEKQKQMLIKEEKQIEEQMQAVADRSSVIIAEREHKIQEKEKLNQKIAAKILEDEAARQDRENIIKMLQEQEYLEKNVQDDIAKRQKLERIKMDTKEALTSQMENRKRFYKEEREKEVDFRRQVVGANTNVWQRKHESNLNAVEMRALRSIYEVRSDYDEVVTASPMNVCNTKIAGNKNEVKMAAEEANERDKKRMLIEKGRAYSQELLAQIKANEAKREKDRRLEESRAQYVWNCDKAWCSEVAEERKKMVSEHVPQLLGYLQAGVVQRGDLVAVREGANSQGPLAALPIEAMAGSNRPQRFSKCNAQCRFLREF